MIESIYKLKIKGAAFNEETILPLFCDSKERISLIYGKNGTGKSTISKAVLKASGRSIPEFQHMSRYIFRNIQMQNQLLIAGVKI